MGTMVLGAMVLGTMALGTVALGTMALGQMALGSRGAGSVGDLKYRAYILANIIWLSVSALLNQTKQYLPTVAIILTWGL